MKRKKIFLILIIVALISIGLFFLYKKIKNSKKIVNYEISNQYIIKDEVKENKEEINISKEDKKENNIDDKKDIAENKNENNDQVKNEIKIESKKDISKDEKENYVIKKIVSFGFQKSENRNIKAIIIHTSYNAIGGDVFDFEKVMKEWKDANVSPHYAIDRSGNIYQLVEDGDIAWHAGLSKLPDGAVDVNGVSIGIEIINDEKSQFSDEQYKALNYLLKNLKSKYEIKYILGHSEIAPNRKTDPWKIDWKLVNR